MVEGEAPAEPSANRSPATARREPRPPQIYPPLTTASLLLEALLREAFATLSKPRCFIVQANMKTKNFFAACLIALAGVTLTSAETVSVADVKMLAKAGLSDEVILSHIRNAHAAFRLSTAEIIELKDTGVSQKVIDFMINTAPVAVSVPVPVQEVSVGTAAPAGFVESIPPAPAPDFVWVSGCWTWRHTRLGYGHWEWVPGMWTRPPHRDAVWIGPRWEPHRGLNVWVDGHWR